MSDPIRRSPSPSPVAVPDVDDPSHQYKPEPEYSYDDAHPRGGAVAQAVGPAVAPVATPELGLPMTLADLLAVAGGAFGANGGPALGRPPEPSPNAQEAIAAMTRALASHPGQAAAGNSSPVGDDQGGEGSPG